MNDLYEFGGLCDVVIRCCSARTIGGKNYIANEPYTKLEDVYVNIEYVTTSSEANAKQNILNTRVGLPNRVQILNTPLTKKVCDLITTSITAQTIGKTYCGEASGNKIYLPETPCDNQLFIYDKEQRVDNFRVEGYIITSDNFINGKQYLIFYNVLAEGNCFDFTTPHYGYFCLEITGKGNTDKTTTDMYIKIPAASLASTGVFDFVRGNILKSPLVFMCIHQNQEQAYFNIG